MAPNTPPIRVSGSVNFGGSVTIDVSLHPKNVSKITLMTFNNSTGKFTQLDGIENQICPQLQLNYYAQALVIDLNFDDCEGHSIPYLWVLGIALGLVVVIVVVAFLMLRNKKQLKNGKNALW